MLQLQLRTRGGTRSNFSDNCINALPRAGPCRHSQAQAFYSKQKQPLHPRKAFSNLQNLLTALCSSERAYLQANDARHGLAFAESYVETALFQVGSS